MKSVFIAKPVTVDEIITRLSFGLFQLILFLVLGLIMLADGCDAILTSLLSDLLQKKWNLSDEQAAMLGGVRYFGMIISSLFFGGLGDWIGRRNTLRYSLILLSVASLVSLWMPEFWSFLAIRCLVGFLFGCCKPVISCCSVEMSPLHVRAAATVGLFIFYGIGSLGTVGLAFWLTPELDPDNYKGLILAQAINIIVATVATLLWLMESPSFQWINNKPEAAIAGLNHIATLNKKPVLTSEEILAITQAPTNTNPKKFSLQRIFTIRYLPRTIFAAFLWWVAAYTFYGFLFLLPRGNDTHPDVGPNTTLVNMAIDVSMLLPGVFAAMPMVELKWLGEVRTMIIFAAIMTLSAFLYVFLSGIWAAIMSSAFIFSSNTFGIVLYPYTSELFDAALRNTGFSFCSFWSRIGGVVCPFVLISIGKMGDQFAYYSFSLHSLFASALLLFVNLGSLEDSQANTIS